MSLLLWDGVQTVEPTPSSLDSRHLLIDVENIGVLDRISWTEEVSNQFNNELERFRTFSSCSMF